MAFLNEERMSKLVQGLRKMFVRSVNGKAIDDKGNVDLEYATSQEIADIVGGDYPNSRT